MGSSGAVTGYLRLLEEEIVLNVELVDARDNRSIWGDRFTRTRSNLLEIEEEFATEIAEALGLELTGEETEELTKRYTRNAEAYQLYLRGRYDWNQRSKEGFERAISYFNEAIELDPDYALANAGLADTYVLQGVYAYEPGAQALQKGEQFAYKALALDNTLAETHVTLALIKHFDRSWDWPSAERGHLRALELNPKSANAHHRYGLYFTAMGRFDDALAEYMEAVRLDPLSFRANTELGIEFYRRGEYERAIEYLVQSVELSPTLADTRHFLGLAYLRSGQKEKALATIQSGPNFSLRTYSLAYLYSVMDREEEAAQLLTTLDEESIGRRLIAEVHIGLGETEKAFDWLDRMFDSEDLLTFWWRWGLPVYDPLRDDPRFTDLLRRMNLEP